MVIFFFFENSIMVKLVKKITKSVENQNKGKRFHDTEAEKKNLWRNMLFTKHFLVKDKKYSIFKEYE